MTDTTEHSPKLANEAPISSARGRPKSEEKREQIFAAATELFPKLGFENVSMDMIAEHAGVSKQTVYSHFRNKDELYSTCISRKCLSYQLSAEFMDVSLPIAEMLHEIGRRFVSLLLSKEALQIYRISVGNAAQHPHLAELFYRAGPEPTCQAVTEYMQHQHKRGVLNIPDARTAASQFLFMLKGEAVMRASLNIQPQPAAEDIENYIASCVAMFLRAYGNKH